MGKKNKINVDLDGNQFVLGIASSERIWKLCWEINKVLEINLSSEVPELSRPSGMVLYSNSDSEGDFDFSLFENNDQSAKIPKIARQFRFWLIVKPRRDKSPDLEGLMRKLKGSEHVSMVMDLSPLNQEKNFLP